MKKIINFIRKIINSEFCYVPLCFFGVWAAFSGLLRNSSDIFKGAFWAVLFGLFSWRVREYFKSNSNRYNRLVYLEHELNASLNDLAGTQMQIRDAIKSPGISLIHPCELILSEKYIMGLGRIELKNDIFSLFVDFKKYNHSLKQITDIFERNFNLIMSQNPPEARTQILNNYYEQLKNQLTGFYDFGKKVNAEIEDCLIKIRFFSKIDKPLLIKYFHGKYYDKKELEKWMIEDRKRLKDEIETLAKKDDEDRRVAAKVANSE